MKKSSLIILFIFITSAAVTFYNCSKDLVETPITPNVNHAPNIPSDPSPADNAINVPRFVFLSWTCTDPDAGDTLWFDIYMGTSNPPVTLVGPNILTNSYDVGLVPSSTTLYWKVVAKDNHNSFTEGQVWCFTTSN